jgi:hypothetical protein
LKAYFRVTVREGTYLYYILFGLLDGVLDVQVRLRISNGVTNTDRGTYTEKILILRKTG